MKIKPIKNYPKYFVSSDGKVLSEKYGYRKELKQHNSRGYRRVFLSKNNKVKGFAVHRLVAKAFIPNLKNKPFTNHKDGNRRNNSVGNLEWVTAKENSKHSAEILKTTGAKMANGRWGYRYTKLYPTEELRSRLVELGIPRNKHNLAELGEMLPKKNKENYPLYIFYNGDEIGFMYNENVVFRTRDTEANARAKMLVYLIENKLLK